MERCDFTELIEGRQCDQAAQYIYAFVDDDGGDRYAYWRCQFHPVAEDEHCEEGLMRYKQPLSYDEAALEAHMEQMIKWNEDHNYPHFNERIA